MSDIKPQIESAQILALLQTYFDKPILQLGPITSGLIARTFSFAVKSREYIIRFQNDNMQAHFEKEKYISENYASPRIPIPPILHLGRFQGFHFAISDRVVGQTLDTLSAHEYQRALPSVIETLCAIHQVNVSHATRFGLFDGQGTGSFTSWRDALRAIREEEADWDFYGKWHALFENSILERDVFELVYERMIRLLVHCPEARYLVHGGYGFGNVLVHEGQVTGVVDWMDAKYGDFVYDIAWLDFWSASTRHQQLAYSYYTNMGLEIPFFPERLLAYKCYISLDGLRFFAKTGEPDVYQWVKSQILNLIS